MCQKDSDLKKKLLLSNYALPNILQTDDSIVCWREQISFNLSPQNLNYQDVVAFLHPLTERFLLICLALKLKHIGPIRSRWSGLADFFFSL
jgi:hypothetical protein